MRRGRSRQKDGREKNDGGRSEQRNSRVWHEERKVKTKRWKNVMWGGAYLEKKMAGYDMLKIEQTKVKTNDRKVWQEEGKVKTKRWQSVTGGGEGQDKKMTGYDIREGGKDKKMAGCDKRGGESEQKMAGCDRKRRRSTQKDWKRWHEEKTVVKKKDSKLCYEDREVKTKRWQSETWGEGSQDKNMTGFDTSWGRSK